MDDEEVARLADIVSERVFESMSKFVGVLEDIVRENELLRGKVEQLELLMFGPDDDDDNDACDEHCGPDCEIDDDVLPVPDDEMDDFFDVGDDIEDDDDLLGSN